MATIDAVSKNCLLVLFITTPRRVSLYHFPIRTYAVSLWPTCAPAPLNSSPKSIVFGIRRNREGTQPWQTWRTGGYILTSFGGLCMNRRYFLSTAAAGGVQLLAAKRAHASPSDQIRVALIGAGGRGGDHVRAIARIPGVELVTVCDPDETRMAEKAASYEKIAGKKPALQQDLRHIMDDKSIDAVTIATCNHWHALATIWACQAGKHVYVEKPVCHDFYEGSQMVAAARRYNRVVQGGTQARSSGRVRKGILALQEGIIGEVYMARCIHYQLRDSL